MVLCAGESNQKVSMFSGPRSLAFFSCSCFVFLCLLPAASPLRLSGLVSLPSLPRNALQVFRPTPLSPGGRAADNREGKMAAAAGVSE